MSWSSHDSVCVVLIHLQLLTFDHLRFVQYGIRTEFIHYSLVRHRPFLYKVRYLKGKYEWG